MFSNVFGSGVKVDTVVDNSVVVPGEMLSGTVSITGEDTSKIKGVHISLVTYCEIDDEDDIYFTLTEGSIEFQGEKLIPFQFPIPVDAPLTKGRVYTLLHTQVDVARAKDPTDADRIEITYDTIQKSVVDAMEQFLGCHLKEVECEWDEHGFRQEFDFSAHRDLANQYGIDEIELSFIQRDPTHWYIAVTVDHRETLFSTSWESSNVVQISQYDAAQGVNHVGQKLGNFIMSII